MARVGSAGCLLWILVLAAIPVRVTAENRPGLDAVIGKRSVVVTGLPPRAQAVVYSFQLRPVGFESLAERKYDVVSDEDGDGSITIDTAEDIEQRSIWVIAELTSGKYVIASPAGFDLDVASIAHGSFRRSASAADRFITPWASADMLYVHPGLGARFAYSEDGAPRDADGGADGFLTLALGDATIVPSSGSGPSVFAPGGLLFAVDRLSMRVVVGRLTGADLEERR